MAEQKIDNALNKLLSTGTTLPAINQDFSQFWSSIGTNVMNNNVYLAQCSNLILTMCEFDLPEGCNAEYLMKSLYFDGKAAFCNDPIMGWINLRATIYGKPNIYDLPNEIIGYSNTGFQKHYKKDDFIFIKSGPMMIPLVAYVAYFCNVIADIEQTARINLKAQKTPITFSGSKDQQLSLINTYMKLEGNVPYLFVNKDFKDQIGIEALNTGAPFIADKLQELKKSYKAELLSFMGLNNVEDKKERMVVDEVNANNQYISSASEILMSQLEPAIEELSKKTGYPCKVRLRTQSEILERDKQNTEADNGNLHNDISENGE